MPGDWMLGLEWPVCSINNKPRPLYLSRCDQCDEKEKRKQEVNEKRGE